jgi:hypothetical protein
MEYIGLNPPYTRSLSYVQIKMWDMLSLLKIICLGYLFLLPVFLAAFQGFLPDQDGVNPFLLPFFRIQIRISRFPPLQSI